MFMVLKVHHEICTQVCDEFVNRDRRKDDSNSLILRSSGVHGVTSIPVFDCLGKNSRSKACYMLSRDG